jgi:hypothetical protein
VPTRCTKPRLHTITLFRIACPIALAPAVIPVVFPRRAVLIAAAVLLGAFVLIAGFSIGLFFAPAAVAMVVAARERGGRWG